MSHCCTSRNDWECVFELIVVVTQTSHMRTSYDTETVDVVSMCSFFFISQPAVGQVPLTGDFTAGNHG